MTTRFNVSPLETFRLPPMANSSLQQKERVFSYKTRPPHLSFIPPGSRTHARAGSNCWHNVPVYFELVSWPRNPVCDRAGQRQYSQSRRLGSLHWSRASLRKRSMVVYIDLAPQVAGWHVEGSRSRSLDLVGHERNELRPKIGFNFGRADGCLHFSQPQESAVPEVLTCARMPAKLALCN